MWKRKDNKRSTTTDSTTDKKEPEKAKSEARISQNDFTEDNDFMKIEVVTPKLNDTGRSEVNPEGNNNQISHSTENHIETVKQGGIV